MKKLSNESGQIMPLMFITMAIVLFTTLIIIGGSQLYFFNSGYSSDVEKATVLAEAGVDKALAALNKTAGSYAGEVETFYGEGSYSITITDKNASTKIIESTGFIPDKTSPEIKRTVKIEASKGTGASFLYGIQVGEGGLDMDKNTTVIGSVYSNGNVDMDQFAQVTGDMYVAGGTSPAADQETPDCSGINCSDFYFGKNISGNNQFDVAQSFESSASQVINKVALRLKKIGNPPNITVRITGDAGGKPNKGNILTTGTLSAGLVTGSYSFVEVSFISPASLNVGTTYWIMLDTSNDPVNYWSWSNDLAQGYPLGAAAWSDNWNAPSPSWNNINGDLAFKTYMGGVATHIYGSIGVTIVGDAKANTLRDLTAGKAYYQVQSNISAGGQNCTSNPSPPKCNPGSADPVPKSFPISQANIDQWKSQLTTTYSGNITGCPANLTSRKYDGSITLLAGCTTIVDAPVWVTGNLNFGQGASIKLNPSYGSSSGIFLVDNFINLDKNNKILGSGTAGSHLFLLSLFNSEDDPGGRDAINIDKEGNSGVLYAPFGSVHIAKENHMTSITAWKLKLDKDVIVEYDEGLSDTFFSSGPGGSFSLIKGTYQIK